MPDDADLTPGGDDLAAAYLDRYGRRERRRRGITFPDDVSTGLRPAERAEAEDRKRAVAPARLSPPEYTIDNEPPPAARRPDTVILGADGRPLPDAQQPRRLLVPDEAFPDSLERAMERLGARAPQLAPRDVTATAADARTGGLAARLASEHGAPRALALTLGLPEAAGSFAAGRVAQAVTDPLGTARAMTVGAGEDVWRGFHTGMRDVRLGDYRQAAGEFGGAALTTAMVALPALAELRAGTRLVARGMAPSGRVLAGAGDLAAAMDRTGAVGARPTPASEVPPEVRARQAVEHNFQTQADIVLAARDRGVLEESGAPQFEHALTGAHLDEVSGLFRRSGGGAHPVADLIERAKPMVAAGDPWRAAVRTVAERDPAFTPAVAEQADQALSIAATKAMPTPARAIRTPKPSDRVASPGAAPAAPSVRSTSKGNALQDFSEQLFTGGDATAHEAEARRWGATEDEIYTARAAGQMPGARHAPAPPRPTEGAPEPPPAAERITAASVRFKDGSVFTGPSHAEALDAAAAAGKNVDEATTDGFVTSHGREVGRADADAIFSGARPAGAIPFRLHAADVAVERGLPEDAGIRGAPIGPWAPGLRRGAVGDLGPGGSGSPLKREGGKPAIEHAAPTTPADIVGEEVAGVGSEDARGFPSRLYSRVGQAINDAPFEKGTAEQWRAHLRKGVPQDEVAGTGVEAMLAEQKGKVLTRAQLAERYNAGRVRLGEVTLGGEEGGARATRWGEYTVPGGENYREHLVTLGGRDTETDYVAALVAHNDAVSASNRRILTEHPGRGLVLEGRTPEEASTIDRLAVALRAAEKHRGESYKSPHWPGVDNPLVHLRTTDRALPSGEKALFLEEVQSDWHQARRRGADVPDAPLKKTAEWTELALKKAIDVAVREGKDRVVWASGDHAATYASGGGLTEAQHTGMSAYYDTVVPGVVRDYGKKLGIPLTVEPVETGISDTGRLDYVRDRLADIEEWIGAGLGSPHAVERLRDERNALQDEFERLAATPTSPPTPNLSFKITPELKQRVMERGQPLGFAHPAVARTVAAAGAGAAVGALQGGTVEEKAKNALVGAGLGVALVAGLPPLVRRLKGPATQAFTDIYAPVREQAPELHATLHAAGAMPPVSAARFVGGLVERSLGPLHPTQRAQFGRRILLDNIEAEATRKAAAATEAEIRAGAEPLPDPTKSERGLWYSRTTAGGALRAADEMETEPLIQELHRRSDAQKVYFADTRRFGPTSAVTQRNEVAIYNIEKILEERDGLDAEVVWNEVGRRRAATPDEEATSFAFGANAPLEFPLHAPAAPVTETGIRSTMLREAADRLTAHATRLRATLPAGLERQPWFARALAQAKMNVQGFNEAGAEGAGVDRANFRQPSLGLYMRMISQDRLNEQLIRSTQEAAAREPGSTVPRQGAALTVLGQRPTVARLTPVGATGPLQGPVNVMREKPAMRNFPPGTAATASRKMATGGARTYVEDFATAAKSDAADKVAKMQRNKVYEAVARLPGAELDPTENAPPGRRALTFNDLNQLVPAPPEGSAIPKGFRRFAVPTEVADAVDQYQRQVRGTTASGHAWRRAAGLVTRSVLLNPAAAMGHALTLASSVGTTMPADAGVIRSLASGVPVAKVATTLDRIRRVDFARQATVTRLHRLALSGALRISADESTGWIDRGHHILFGPNGIDPRARVVASEDFEAGARKAGLTTEDPAYIALERDYVTEHAGNYVGRNQGSASQFLQDYGIAPFIAINRAKYGTSLRAVVGSTGIPGASLGTRAAVVARGPVGVAAALTGAGYLLSGHSAAENAPGHETDLATGVYHLEDGGYAYFRGSPDDAAQQFGARAREVYLRKGLMDPTASAAIRLLEPIATAASGDRVSELLRASANAAMGLVGPAPGAAVGLGLGSTLYVDRDGTLGKLQGVHLEKNADLVDRLLAVTRNVNTGAALALPSTPGARSVSSSMFGNLNPFTTARAGSLPRLGIERREVEAWQQAVTSRIYAERDPTARQALMDAALEEATSAGYTGPALRAGFQRAVNRAATNRAGAAAIKFENRIRGTAPRPDAAERYMRRFGGAPAIPDYERR